MPKLGLEMDTGTVVEWFVSEGDDVSEGSVIAEIESAKTTAEVEAREDGVLRRVLLAEGEETEPGGPMAVVADADADVDAVLAEAGEDSPEAKAESSEPAATDSPAGGQAAATQTDVRASPRAKRRAEELGVDLATVEGTGPQGAVTESDVEAAATDAESDAAGADSGADAVRASPRAKRRADELDVTLSTVEGTGPQSAVTEGDVEAAAEAAEHAAEAAESAESGASAEATAESSAAAATEPETPAGRVFAAPSARRLARELGVDVASVSGSGPGGRITEADVRAATGGGPDAQASEPEAERAGAGESGAGDAEGEPPGTRTEDRPLSGMRRTIAQRLGASDRTAVHVTEHRTADAEELLAAAAATDEALAPDVSVTDVLLVALSATLDAHPEFNATFEDDVHHLRESHDVCVAVDVEDGLIAPVVRGVDSLSLADLAEKRARVTQRALSGDYTMDDLSGGTFTVSNLGVLGVESFDPVINPPQVAILGVNAIRSAVVPAGDGEVAVRDRISFSLSFDHRVVDGADAARFLGTFVDHVEDPWPLVIAAGGR
ncbi:2-oxo acid dehydrogenase subunit E2 [Halomicrococcus gelatinilyticus]|uniref:2-oxo acid dehydrogenase subunit E2 n=1 Tax=Halomicrococcus gelatinilyticus TaxID=1702103 RepID=UPI002E158E8F